MMKKELLQTAYAQERDRLLLLAEADTPQGEYACPVFGEGNRDAAMLFIGEAPGAEETKMGRPFVGKAGRQLDELIDLAALNREDLYITNVVKYRPVIRNAHTLRNRTPGAKEMDLGLPLLAREIQIVAPKVIVTLGNTPLKAVCLLSGMKPAIIGEVHGTPVAIQIDGKRYTLFSLYHPASGIYNRSLIDVMKADAALLGEHLVKRDESGHSRSFL